MGVQKERRGWTEVAVLRVSASPVRSVCVEEGGFIPCSSDLSHWFVCVCFSALLLLLLLLLTLVSGTWWWRWMAA